MKASLHIFVVSLSFVLLIVFSYIGFITSRLNAQEFVDENINVTVRISVCGDGVAEFPEDCDGGDLGGSTCRELGFFAGSLYCTYACEFETDNCFGVAPTATPSATNTPESKRKTETDGGFISRSGGAQVETGQLITNVIVPAIKRPRGVNKNLFILDGNGDGFIERFEIADVVGKWIEFFRNRNHGCDLNDDIKCNLIDFSILMYHVDRDLNVKN